MCSVAQISFHTANAQCKKLFRPPTPLPRALSFKMDIHLWIANRIKISRRHKVIQWLFGRRDVNMCLWRAGAEAIRIRRISRAWHWQSEKIIPPSGRVFHVCVNATLFVCPFALGWHVSTRSIYLSNLFLLWLSSKWNMIIINRQMNACYEFKWIWIRMCAVAEEWHTICMRIRV